MERFVHKILVEEDEHEVYIYNCNICPQKTIWCHYPGAYSQCFNETLSRIFNLEKELNVAHDKRLIIETKCGYKTNCVNCHHFAPEYAYTATHLTNFACSEECLQYLYRLEEEKENGEPC